MKFLILVSSVLAVATAGWEPIQEKYHGPLHYPKIHKGVPVEPAAVQHARMLHLMAVAAASYNNGYDHHHEDEGYYHQHDDQDNYHHEEAKKWHGPLHYPKIYNGVPVEPKEVQHAREEHLKAVSAISHENHYQNEHHYHNDKYDYNNHESPVIGHDGHPLDTIEVQAAKAKHFAAVEKALSQTTLNHYRKRRSAQSYVHFKQIVDHAVPVKVSSHDHHYVPTPVVDTLEVQHEKAAHLAAHALLASNNKYDDGHYDHHKYESEQYDDGHYDHHKYENEQYNDGEYDHHKYENEHYDDGEYDHHKYDNEHYDDGHYEHDGHNDVYGIEHHNYDGHNNYHHQHVPVIGHDGTPIDTPEVQHARAAHLAAHAAAKAKYY